MVRSEPGTEHPPREALRPREAVGDVFLARWPSQTERRFVGQGRPVPSPPAVAACSRGGVDPASSGAGRAAGLAVRGADTASDAGAASAGGRPERAVALRRLLPQRWRRRRGRGGAVGRRRPEPVRRTRGRRGRRLGHHRPVGRTPGLGRCGRGGGAGADPERRRPRPRHAVARRRAVPSRFSRHDVRRSLCCARDDGATRRLCA